MEVKVNNVPVERFIPVKIEILCEWEHELDAFNSLPDFIVLGKYSNINISNTLVASINNVCQKIKKAIDE